MSKEKIKPSNQLSFCKEWEYFLETYHEKYSRSQFRSMQNSYRRFLEFTEGKEVSFKDVNSNMLSRYNRFLINTGLANNSIHSCIAELKNFLSYANKLNPNS